MNHGERTMNHLEHEEEEEEVSPRSYIKDANLLIFLPAWSNTVYYLNPFLKYGLSRSICLLKTFFFTSRLIKSRFTLA